MKKDIEIPVVKDVAIAVVKEQNELMQDEWNVYLINLQDKPLQNVLVSSRGYGSINKEARKTSDLRHFLEEVEARSYQKIEPIIEEVFGLNNEYWVSFYQDNLMYDKKFIFLPETISAENLVNVPLLHKKGVVIG